VFNLQIERLSEDGEKCLLDRDAFATTVADELANTGITLSSGNYPSLYIQVNSVAASELCYSSVNAKINYYAQVPHPKNPNGTLAQVVLWNDYYLVSSEKQAHQEYVTNQIKLLIEAFVTDWKKQNPSIAAAVTVAPPVNPTTLAAPSVAKVP